jgi:hypothetical protein
MYRSYQFQATSTGELLDSLFRNDAVAGKLLTAVIRSENYQLNHKQFGTSTGIPIKGLACDPFRLELCVIGFLQD